MAGELVGRAQTSVLFLSYGARLRECRRLVHAWVNRHAMPAAYPAQERGSHRLLGALLDDPARFSDHVRTCAAPYHYPSVDPALMHRVDRPAR